MALPLPKIFKTFYLNINHNKFKKLFAFYQNHYLSSKTKTLLDLAKDFLAGLLFQHFLFTTLHCIHESVAQVNCKWISDTSVVVSILSMAALQLLNARTKLPTLLIYTNHHLELDGYFDNLKNEQAAKWKKRAQVAKNFLLPVRGRDVGLNADKKVAEGAAEVAVKEVAEAAVEEAAEAVHMDLIVHQMNKERKVHFTIVQTDSDSNDDLNSGIVAALSTTKCIISATAWQSPITMNHGQRKYIVNLANHYCL
ncbi:hypothetical protein BT96DRAFT_933087 [Gymnopus androsaceus JB14]|uniref:Uncharacterized protein n=1 Tax=Gymnopus androsaceus JB14 TaxID=1447944 RepID=A0A6A4IAS2_9AGAR|nr:hypothetical protein BT96DRAFT_933087 [Gymnopus androsaceus JB14]